MTFERLHGYTHHYMIIFHKLWYYVIHILESVYRYKPMLLRYKHEYLQSDWLTCMSKQDVADSAQPRKHSIATRPPFLHEKVGSGE